MALKTHEFRTGRRVVASIAALAALSLPVLSCSDDHADDHEHGEEGVATGAVCPSGSTLTYDGFARPFMTAYCTRCHSSTLSGAARNGAPAGHDFDTEAGILAVADHVDGLAAGGPNAVNTAMPPDGAKPTEAERRQLGEWLACASK
jgi:uncharacterized membrane protein